MKRGPLVLVGMAIAIIGYALVYTGLTTLNPSSSPTGAPIGVLDSLTPNKVQRGKVTK